MRLTRTFSQVPVSALALYRPPTGPTLVLVGEDTHVKVYEAAADASRLACQFGVFAEQPVHGIDLARRPDGTATALAWGGRRLAAFSLDGLAGGRSPGVVRATAPDWVYHGCLAPSGGREAVVVTAHNEVVRLSVDLDAGSIAVGEVVSPARPILFTARLAWISDSCVLVAAGTAFGEILVWRCLLDQGGGGGSHEMLFSLTGHQGSIYGLDISPPLTVRGGEESVRLLASCSDDRTVRVWDITVREGSRRTYGADHFNAPRETGFGDVVPSTVESNAPVAVAMGHVSRIWGVRFGVGHGGVLAGAGLPVYTFGEDSTTQVWKLDVDETTRGATGQAMSGRLTHQNAFSLHDGKHLWSSALSEAGLVTGGADGKVSLIQESPRETTSCELDGLVTLDVQDLCQGDPSATMPRNKKPEAVGRLDFVSQYEILVCTSAGRLLLGSFRGSRLHWERLHTEGGPDDDDCLRRCYVLKCVSEGVAVMGTTDGHIYFYRSGRVARVASVTGKIVDISCLSSPHDTERSADVLVYTYGVTEPHYLSLDTSSGAVRDRAQVHGLHPRFLLVSAARVGEYLVLGSRFGYISIVRRDDGGRFSQILDVAPINRDAVTSIVPLPAATKPGEPAHDQFLATSRDGRYRIYEVESDGDGSVPRIHLRHDAAPPFGPLLEGAWFSDAQLPELVLFGFNRKNFVVWNETRREEQASVDCGGGHRTISFRHGGSDAEPLRFAFNRASKLSIYSQDRPRCGTVKKGTHGREIRSLSCNGRYMATGAEDTTIRIWGRKGPGDEGEMPCLAYIKSHTAGIQTVRWLGEEYLFSSSGNEEFMVWRVRMLTGGYEGLGVVREAVFQDKSPDGDLRIMDFDVRREAEDHDVTISMVFSSSQLRTYSYSAGQGFRLRARGAYTGACLTQVRHLEPAGGEDLSVLTASTDGHVCVWRTKDEGDQRVFALAQAVQVHQSSIKCLDMMAIETADERSYCVVTGGDDNALGVTVLGGGPRAADLVPRSQVVVKRAHAAAVNGMVTAKEHGRIVAVTVSNDQRVKTWEITTGQPGGVRLVGDVYSSVADPGDVEFVTVQGGGEAATLMVAGVGAEVWRLDV